MKILMISNHLGVQSGVQRYVQNLLLNLDTDRYQIDLFVGACPPDQTSTAPALEAHGVHIIAVPDHKKDRILQNQYSGLLSGSCAGSVGSAAGAAAG